MRITSIRTVCFEQPAVPIHAKRFSSPQEIVLTVVQSDTGLEGYAMARAPKDYVPVEYASFEGNAKNLQLMVNTDLSGVRVNVP